jgi:hypothetical protein
VYTPGSYDWLALLSHEFQHMVHWNQDPNEAVWANEGLSELATIVAGYPAEDGGAYFSRPDTPLLEWNVDPTQNTPDYAASFAFMTFLFSHFGSDGIRHIVAAKGNGPNGIEEGLAADGQPHAFDDLFLDWIVANAVDDPKFLDGRFSYLGNPLGPVHPDPFDLGDGPNTVQPYATDYYDATPAVRGRRIDLQFQGDPTVGLLQRTSEATGAVWWSGRGDSGDARLTRSFDLTGLTEASLDFRMFHELEPNWDFAYYLVSTDNGGSWTRVATSRTTDDDPNGNNYGSGLTGYSDGWVDEELNLTPFVGGPVLVRLEVVTDDAVSLMGMAVDDIRLDAVGFRDDAEGDQGWTAEGWTRIVPVVPVRWAPQAIVFDGDGILGILRPRVADDGSAHFGADGIPEDARVIVAVSQITRGGRHPVAYTLAQRNDAQALLQPTGAAIIY